METNQVVEDICNQYQQDRYGRLTVLYEVPKADRPKGYTSRMFVCVCDCVNVTKPITLSDLKRGKTKSCGCFHLERIKAANTKHGDGHSRLNCVWQNMKQRCYNTKMRDYPLYGGRGIKICDEWRDDYSAFRKWAFENGYDPDAKRGETTIDRIDVNGDYEPSNCRIVTQKAQCNNLRKNLLIEIDGRTQTLKQWAEESGIDEAKIRYRYHHGYTGQDLLKEGRCRK